MVVVVVVVSSGADEEWYMVTVKMPPVVGIRATSPRSVLKVERSSWANWFVSILFHRDIDVLISR